MNFHASDHRIQQSIAKLLDYCKDNDWAGFDPYDGLNSRVFRRTPFFQSKICRLFLTQFIKRFPINLRPLLLVPKQQNPKGLALFASSLIRLKDVGLVNRSDLVKSMVNRLIELRTLDKPYYCWGYNFDWQSRNYFIPRFEPNIICTTFAANAILDAFEEYSKSEYLNIAVSAGHFLLSGLNISKDGNGLCFSYTPLDYENVHNANLLGAALLSRLYSITGEKTFLDFATRAVRYSIAKQNPNGSWSYAEHKTQRWIDNFHTGYNLVALKKFCEYTGNSTFLENISKGYAFYIKHLFTAAGMPKYYHNRTYPVDIHSIAQSMITLCELKAFDERAIELSKWICRWALKNMQSKKGYFFYQQGRLFKNRVSYMRWSQAWMLLALSTLQEHYDSVSHRNTGGQPAVNQSSFCEATR